MAIFNSYVKLPEGMFGMCFYNQSQMDHFINHSSDNPSAACQLGNRDWLLERPWKYQRRVEKKTVPRCTTMTFCNDVMVCHPMRCHQHENMCHGQVVGFLCRSSQHPFSPTKPGEISIHWASSRGARLLCALHNAIHRIGGAACPKDFAA